MTSKKNTPKKIDKNGLAHTWVTVYAEMEGAGPRIDQDFLKKHLKVAQKKKKK